MYRPISLKKENNLLFELYRNRRETIGEIDPKYVTSIEYELHNFTTLTLEIPNKLHRNGKDCDYYIYDVIKGKMIIVMNFNGEMSKFIVDDNIEVVEKQNGKTKKLKAYSYEKALDKKTLLISDGATRQLYRPKDETVEVSEGILNWFEAQTGWKVGHVDELARKETMLYYTNESMVLFDNIEKQGLNFGDTIWERYVNISVPDRAINMVVSYPEMETYDNNNNLWKRESISHTFANLPYTITHISAKYTTSDNYKYGITYEITYEYEDSKGAKQTQKHEYNYGFANITNLKWVGRDITLTHETNKLEEHLNTKYRFFEQCSTKWYQFLTKDVANAFNCVFLFDSYNSTINVYNKDTFGTNNGLYMGWEFISSVNKTHKVGDIVSRLYIESPNTSISEENPLGTEYVECFDYYKKSGIMSDDLVVALDKYDTLVNQKQIEFLQVKLEKTKVDQKLTKAESELLSLQEKLRAENAILTAYIKANNNQQAQEIQSGVVANLEKEISDKLSEIQGYKDTSNGHSQAMVQIGIDIQKENAVLDGNKIFTQEDLLELDDYIIEGSISNDYYTIPISLYNYGVEEVKKLNDVAIDFTITARNFVDKIVHPKGWSYYIKVGEKVEIDDREVVDKDGFVQIYGFKFSPSKNELSSLKFTNNKEQTTAVKTISDIGRQLNSTSNMTSYWKDVWKDASSNNVYVSQLIEQGLDLAAQVARGKNTINRIDISEAGIYIIDNVDDNKQVYLGSSLIAITTDRWKTSRTAIDADGVVAQTLMGKVILGDKLYIGNDEETIVIKPNGISLYDSNALQSERIFLGLETQANGIKKAVLRLHSADGNNKLVLSEKGIYQVFPVQARDSFDRYNSFKVSFYLPTSLQRLDEARLILNLEKFRAYSKAMSTQPSETQGFATASGGQYSTTRTSAGGGQYTATKTSTNGGQYTTTKTSTNGGQYTTTRTSSNGGRYTTTKSTEMNAVIAKDATTGRPQGITSGNLNNDFYNHHHVLDTDIFLHRHDVTISIPNHTHDVTITVPNHTHDVTITVPNHTHDVTVDIPNHAHDVTIDIPSHTHNVDVTIPSHSHDIVYGIYEYQQMPTVRILLDGVVIADNISTTGQFDLSNSFTYLGGTHNLEIVSLSKPGNTEGLGRASLDLFVSGFVSY